jgi:hypothetical protein
MKDNEYLRFHTLINLLKNSLDRLDRYYMDLDEEEDWRHTSGCIPPA